MKRADFHVGFLTFILTFTGPIMRVNPDVRFYRSFDGVYWDPDEPEAKRNLIEAFQESDKKSRLAQQSQHHRFHVEKKRPGGRVPLGIREITDNALIPDQNYPIVLFIFELASWGYSERHITNVLNEMGLMEGHQWAHTEIHYILNNPLYIGDLALGRRRGKQNGALKSLGDFPLISGRYNALVPKDLWRLAHAQLDNKSRDKSVRTKTSFLLSGVMKCATCGVHLQTRNSLKPNAKGIVNTRSKKGSLLRYYYCPQCGRRVNPSEIEPEIIGRLNQELGRHITMERIVKRITRMKSVITSRVKVMDDEIRRRRYQMNQLESGYYSNTWDTDTIGTLHLMAAERISELESLKQQAMQTENSLNELTDDPDTLFRLVHRAQTLSEALPMHELRALVLNMVDEISVHVGRSGVLTIESMTYRTLPLPYLEESFNVISSL